MPFFEVLDTALWTDIALFMRDHPKLKFNYMACLSGVDYPEEGKLGLVANLESLGVFGHKLAVKVKCPREADRFPVLPVCGIRPTGMSARRMTCWECSLRAIPICAGFSARTTGKAGRSARITRYRRAIMASRCHTDMGLKS